MRDSSRDAIEGVSDFVKRCDRIDFSGTVVFSLHFRQGGVGRTQVRTEQDLARAGTEPVPAGRAHRTRPKPTPPTTGGRIAP